MKKMAPLYAHFLSRAHDRKFNYELDSSLGGAV